MKSSLLFLIVCLLLGAITPATAEVYRWIDKDGKLQYTDTPPPPGAAKTEAKKIDASPATGSGAAGDSTKALQERSKDFDKRRLDAQEKAKKSEAEQKAELERKAVNDENCRLNKNAIKQYEIPEPIRRTNDKGELEYVSDEARASELAKLKETVAKECK
ncbi:MAG: DUF4124 domain-containing protein [Betaproteobacteria bacterium]|nr:DUF4124 domain-containing protein [Betaproteobacteria bacterium]